MKLKVFLLCLFIFVDDVCLKRSYIRSAAKFLHNTFRKKLHPPIHVHYPPRIHYTRYPEIHTRRHYSEFAPPTFTPEHHPDFSRHGSDFTPPPERFSTTPRTDYNGHPPQGSPDGYEYLAAVHSKNKFCAAILITKNFVLAPAHCLEASEVVVYVGAREYPEYYSKHREPSTQIFNATEVLFHEGFSTTKEGDYINDVALVRLPTPAALNNKVGPGVLISKDQTDLFNEKFATIVGWVHDHDLKMKTEYLELLDLDTCRHLFGSQFLESQQRCAKSEFAHKLNLTGNTITIKYTIVGFLEKKISCSVGTNACNKTHVFINLVPFLDWISEKVGVPLSQLTREYKREETTLEPKKKEDDLDSLETAKIKQSIENLIKKYNISISSKSTEDDEKKGEEYEDTEEEE